MKCEPGCSGREEGQLRGVVLELEEEQCSSSPSVPALPCPVLAESPVLLWPVSPLTLLEVGILKQGPFTAPWFCDFALAGGVGEGGTRGVTAKSHFLEAPGQGRGEPAVTRGPQTSGLPQHPVHGAPEPSALSASPVPRRLPDCGDSWGRPGLVAHATALVFSTSSGSTISMNHPRVPVGLAESREARWGAETAILGPPGAKGPQVEDAPTKTFIPTGSKHAQVTSLINFRFMQI